MTPEQQLDIFIDRFSPEVAANARAALAMVAARLPGAVRLVYDNYNALAIGFGPNEHAKAIVCSIALYPRWASLFLTNGPTLADPRGSSRRRGERGAACEADARADRERCGDRADRCRRGERDAADRPGGRRAAGDQGDLGEAEATPLELCFRRIKLLGMS